MNNHRCVTVFGGSHAQLGEPAYEQATRLGELLAFSGYGVLTGGYIGTMEAVSRGAASGGAHVIGVTCEQIENWRPNKANSWVMEEIRCSTLPDRIVQMLENCHAAIALPGGPGTLTEIALTWNLLTIQALSPKPLILIGSGWKEVFNILFRTQGGYIPDDQRKLLLFASNVDTAVDSLNTHFRNS